MSGIIKELPMLSLNNIYKSYGSGEGKVDALKNINLEIEKGEFLALCGPSGSGKSTLLNILSGIDKPSFGSVMFLRKLLNNLPEEQLSEIRGKHLGFIFQFFNLIPVLSVFDNVFFPLVLNGHTSKKEAKERALYFIESVGLMGYTDRKPGQLSGGQQQRVAIARALAHDPQVVIADEPTGNLDLVTGEAILDLLLKINRETRTTFIISTHSSQLKERARRVVEIKDGVLVHDSQS
ncbi:putative ABC transporter ATP-binding protein [Enterobacter cloacae]|jgi:ABC-type antimicrobial peptide transport system, ATPase component|uniref:ABC transporter ATP-binding protein n=1 Tax=Enterobacter sichuanensis TaxID=2071710 RepID=A0ABS6GI79_9ENTR|nr:MULTISPECIES: ABC transporter ATP-binding protein [Enterobacter]OZU99830.1 ABC transporter ATP-binding protein [Enterobacter cloacae]KLW90651.1 ABC transporter ATP-binding protein [Enterobacter sp. BIDMC92]MBO2915617.1 ABC transporter ATP-binding protein [Enterobacter sichuanensis]MBO2934802.1 ABC transporter ATP-binding protein [Enterobacter sichuanensis]MBU5926155.1 ABC transporter ATP-binding protein [Enterobacter sichuanensis]